MAVPIYIPTNSVPGFPILHFCANLLLFFFLITAILTGLRRYLIVALICISPKISDSEHLFICLLAICVFSLEKCLVRSFPLCFLFLPFVSPLFQKTTVFCCYSLGFCFMLLSCMSSF